ncbi:MAG TPA: guanylate kinase [Candidatus Polarisedimenticolaceae bacterium]|nr:guanylate kinase [Candidatus Polarisedimenticolaceae bacterium]
MSGQESPRGVLFVLSAPSGTGKSSLCRRLIEEVPGLQFSVSFTTRRRRAGEENGKQYWFVDDARFDAMVGEDAFLEWAEVFGQRYGTGRVATAQVLVEGRDLLLDIDVQGARQVREAVEDSVSVFLLPPDFTTLEGRLRSRRSEDEGEVARRLALAGAEAEEFAHYDYLVINDDLERATADLGAIVRAERRRTGRRRDEAARILATFPHRVSG